MLMQLMYYLTALKTIILYVLRKIMDPRKIIFMDLKRRPKDILMDPRKIIFEF